MLEQHILIPFGILNTIFLVDLIKFLAPKIHPIKHTVSIGNYTS